MITILRERCGSQARHILPPYHRQSGSPRNTVNVSLYFPGRGVKGDGNVLPDARQQGYGYDLPFVGDVYVQLIIHVVQEQLVIHQR